MKTVFFNMMLVYQVEPNIGFAPVRLRKHHKAGERAWRGSSLKWVKIHGQKHNMSDRLCH